MSEFSEKYRREEDDGPVQEYQIPDPPDWLDERETRTYHALGARIQASICCITASDWLALGMFAHWLCIHQDAVVEHREKGATCATTTGGTRKSGAHLVLEQTTRQVNEYCTRFGLTPSARQDIKNLRAQDDDDLESLLEFVPGEPAPAVSE